MPSLEELAKTAMEAASAAGSIQKEKFGNPLNVDAKMTDDIKLEADRLCEKAIIDTIRARYPAHAIMAEESGSAEGSDYIWYIDPLDGTVNFFYGIPYFCTTLACYRKNPAVFLGDPLVGVTYAPPTNEMFIGMAGFGATLNGKPVQVREEPALEESLLVSAYGSGGNKLRFTREVTLSLSEHSRKTRNLGAAAYDMANVAAGRASGFVEYGVNAWDVAAGKILVEAAGGAFFAKPVPNGKLAVVASGKNIHAQLKAAVDGFEV